MARNQRTAEELDAIAGKMEAIAITMRAIASSMREAGTPNVLVHSSMPENTHIPAIEDWADKLKVDVRAQVRAFLTGVQSKAELHRQKNEKQKRVSAAKPPSAPKTATKKTS